MTSKSITTALQNLEVAKHDFSRQGCVAIERALLRLTSAKLNDSDLLIRYHEALLFLRAYPQNSRLLKLTEAELRSFQARVKGLSELGMDLTVLEDPQISGIAGTSVSDTFGYYIVEWLVNYQPGRVALDEDWVEDDTRLGATLSRFMPLLEEDATVEANVPYRTWIDTGKGARPELQWLLNRFAALDKTVGERAELYDSLRLYVRWLPPYRATRTGMRLPVKKIFYHQDPLIKRREISLVHELQEPELPVTKLAPVEGKKILDLTRETSTIRYRELYGFTHGDERRVLRVEIGRGTELFITGLPAQFRLPLRAYHAAMIFKNGVAIGYFEGLSLFERMESGFNLYYTFRDGETAWLYAQILRVFRQLLGVSVFTLDPYQIGFENEEGIESGAFWFYRKLGFRPTRPELLALTIKEEKRLAETPGYRTASRTLRKLAAGYMIYELEPVETGSWDNFQVRNIGLAVQRQMARKFEGEPEKIEARSSEQVAKALDINLSEFAAEEVERFRYLALPLALISDLSDWPSPERQQLVKMIRAKAGSEESHYLRVMQDQARLRSEFIRLGSR